MSNLTLEQVTALGRHRWTVALLVVIAELNGARFVELLHALPISRESLTRALGQAIEGGWIIRNPGHGHPLRPEYIVSATGMAVSGEMAELVAAKARLGMAPSSLGRWSLPVLFLLSAGLERFNLIQRALSDAGPRGLTLTLKSLADAGLVSRRIVEGWPPATSYALTSAGEALARAL